VEHLLPFYHSADSTHSADSLDLRIKGGTPSTFQYINRIFYLFK
jgi:hypothetical protein